MCKGAEYLVHPRARLAREELRGGLVGNKLPLGNNDHAAADRLDLLQDVRRKDDGLLDRHALYERPDLVLLVRVEAVRRLVQDERRRVVQEGLCESDALLVALGERLDRLVSDRGEVGEGDGPLDLVRARRAAPETADFRDESEEFADGHFRIGRGVFGQVAELAFDGHRVLEDIDSVDIDRSRVGPHKPGYHLHRRGLTRTVGSEEAQDLAAFCRKAHAVHRALGAIEFFEAFDFYHIVKERGLETGSPV